MEITLMNVDESDYDSDYLQFEDQEELEFREREIAARPAGYIHYTLKHQHLLENQ